VFIILKQRIDGIKVETDVSVHDQEVVGMENDKVCGPQEFEAEVSHILK
jgi:hypothetical protein